MLPIKHVTGTAPAGLATSPPAPKPLAEVMKRRTRLSPARAAKLQRAGDSKSSGRRHELASTFDLPEFSPLAMATPVLLPPSIPRQGEKLPWDQVIHDSVDGTDRSSTPTRSPSRSSAPVKLRLPLSRDHLIGGQLHRDVQGMEEWAPHGPKTQRLPIQPVLHATEQITPSRMQSPPPRFPPVQGIVRRNGPQEPTTPPRPKAQARRTLRQETLPQVHSDLDLDFVDVFF